jgi:hypothetical protein
MLHFILLGYTARKRACGRTAACLAVIVNFLLPCSAVPDETGDPLDIIIIVNKSVKEDRIDPNRLREFFLKIKKHWSGTDRVLVVNAADERLRDDFRNKVLKMSASEEERYWQAQHVMASRTEPATFNNTVKAVFMLKGAVSYVYRKDYREGLVKAVSVIPARPAEPPETVISE